jgi:NTE family protein
MTMSRPPVLVDLALQGGGAHGAFTWGVLDRLLEDDWIEIEAVSGTSAGAMNAAVMASGLPRGRTAARQGLDRFWKAVAEAGRFGPLQRSPLDQWLGRWTLDSSPGYVMMDLAARLVSPYDLGQRENPLGRILAAHVDIDAIRGGETKLFVTATSVRTGKGRVFRNAEITADALLASACLPTMFRAVEIGGEAYWDGGYAGNPTLTPLIKECRACDTILVQVNPVEHLGELRAARDILNRLNEISFNAVLLKELRMLALLAQSNAREGTEAAAWARMRMHRIASADLAELDASTKLLTEWEFLLRLKAMGRAAAEGFLAAHADDLGRRGSLDLAAFVAEA